MRWPSTTQGEKECLNSETTELKQKIRYLQDQLLPLSKQREYQEKEIQRLNRVRAGLTMEDGGRRASQRSVTIVSPLCSSTGSRGGLKLAFAFVLTTTAWPGQLRRRRQQLEETGAPHSNRRPEGAGQDDRQDFGVVPSETRSRFSQLRRVFPTR